MRLILLGARKVVETVTQQKGCVLVHCSDGWDRTSQLCALSLLMMDRSYRTIDGFEVLIRKEWISAGHKFKSRCDHFGDRSQPAHEFSPIFLQFIDCVWQLMMQNPTQFQFNDHLLVYLLDALYSCQFSDFLAENDQERVKKGLRHFPSVWKQINAEKDLYVSHAYIPTDDVLVCDMSALQFWADYYLRHEKC
eukprot:c2218_g1_i2.p2 GENE.c2218_g1_i2~~c2218_g1_i2.p2  ORF type:complete len:193 (-),score=39.24 c2218_g1_i2:29-607(-)